MERAQKAAIVRDLSKKMVFLTGPRQVGKTTLAKEKDIKQVIEVKLSDSSLHPGLCYFHEKYGYPAIHLVKELKKPYQTNGIEVLQSIDFLKTLLL